MSQPHAITGWPASRGSDEVSRDDAIQAAAWLVVSEATSREEATGKPADLATVAREMNRTGFANILSAEGAVGDDAVLATLSDADLDEVIAQARDRAANEGTRDWT